MATAADLIQDLKDRLDDEGNTKYSEAMKIRFLNRGQAAMFPKIYRTVRDATLALVADTFEYAIPTAVGSNTKIVALEVEDANSRWHPLERYNIIPGLTDPILQLKGNTLPGPAAANIRITAMAPLTAFTTSASVFDGPPFSEELPVLYAMSLAAGREVESRMRHRRLPTVEGFTDVSADDQMTSSQFWMQQFELLLERLAMPLPSLGF